MLFLVALSAYLLGCISTGYYLTRVVARIDLRTHGSNTAGAQNAGRVLGRAGFAATLVGDATKGALAVLLAQALTPDTVALGIAMVGVIVGHLWPVQLGWKGGKGLSPGLGAFLMVDLVLVLLLVAIAAAGAVAVRNITGPVLMAVVLAPAVAHVRGLPLEITLAITAMSGLVIWAHRSNLRELLRDFRSR